MTLLKARGITKNYGRIRVLHGIDLDIEEGSTHAIIGPNGAGKTTLFRVLSGEVAANGGRIEYRADDVTALPDWRRVRMGIGRSFQVAQVFREMTTFDNMLVAAEARLRNEAGRHLRTVWSESAAARTRAWEVQSEVGLADKANGPAANLALSDKKRLELGMALTLGPDLLMLDEPMAGMSPSDRTAAVSLIARLKQEHGMTLLLTEHDMDVVFALATHLTVLHQGEIVASGEPSVVREMPVVRQLYLGKEASHA